MTAALPAAILFENGRRIAAGSLADVAIALKRRLAQPDHGVVLAFGHASGRVLDLNLAGTEAQVTERYERIAEQQARLAGEPETTPRGPGRPKLGVVAREITLLPRHWEWLSAQPGGASVALRRLVDEARKTSGGRDAARAAQDAAYKFMGAIAGNFTGYEETLRALYAGDAARFFALTDSWPADVRDHARLLASPAFEPAEAG